ncbi:MAG: D-hexose-6-phosphate mutarotase [Gammaproteobacteria bacterium]|nr:D-hexose-6-phosphate mutarotase [Gammaproteobacteria bacterium]
MSIDSLNQKFAIKNVLTFRTSAEGAIIADIDNAFSTASISLSGGHVMSWKPKDQAQPVVWLSEQAKVAPGKSIRGGVPICWPWFGAHASEASFPGHGHARTTPWSITASSTLPGGETRVELQMNVDEKSKTFWPHNTPLSLNVTIGKRLQISLTTRNDTAQPVTITEALHTYFQISDIDGVSVSGLENCDYFDKVEDFAKKKQQGEIRFAGETDRVYVNTKTTCVIHDAALKRRIHIGKSSSASTVVWTPWTEKAEKMGDMGANQGWRKMLCVESANAMENAVSIAPGASHSLTVDYWVEAI